MKFIMTVIMLMAFTSTMKKFHVHLSVRNVMLNTREQHTRLGRNLQYSGGGGDMMKSGENGKSYTILKCMNMIQKLLRKKRHLSDLIHL